MRKIKEAIDDTYKDAPAKAAKYFQQMKAELEKGGTMSKNMTTVMFNAGIEKNITKLQEAKDAYKKEIQAINAIFSITSPAPKSPGKTTDNKVNNSPTHTPEKSSVPDYDQQIINLKQNYAVRKLTQEEYEKKLDNLELAHLQYRLKTFEGTEEKRLELQQKSPINKSVSAKNRIKKKTVVRPVISDPFWQKTILPSGKKKKLTPNVSGKPESMARIEKNDKR